ncbi:UTRA domain-containing protein [Virgibacillus dakarensis]|uniref:HTH-type transcriptional regulator YurK n=1 Tax=Lentibacillus populi TaxID=1827502 RepID=A0A9W5TWN5_9BACI|nr:UTRA domain-containing protein [Lentibacillus populi]MTW85817.1 UTRA domain-containing protein [Virgibacillus dakarensis]GGB39213.1 putative HTH-type transcriptional regulator YurK [Lentibacillus populi]
MKLKNASQIPLYHQLKQIIIEDIESGKYETGEQLPTEMELCKKYGVSRITVRRAVSDLVDEKILYRKQGKGTFVSESKIKRELISIGSFSDITTQSGKEPSTQILENKIKKPNGELCSLFKIMPEDNVLELKRLLSINGKPFIIETSYYPISRFPKLETYIGSNVSTYKILRDYYDVEINKAEKTLDVTLSDVEQSAIFECDLNSVMYLLRKTAYDTNNEVVHVSNSLILGSKVTFTFTVENIE